MANLRMGDVFISGSVVFEGVSLDTYNKLIALLSEVNASIEPKKEDLPAPLTEEEVAESPKEEPKPVKPKTPREERAVKFGAKLKALRQAHGLSRKELSDMIDYTDSSICAWETGVNIPSTAAMKLLKDVFVGEDLTY